MPLVDQLNSRADYGYNCGLALVGYNSLAARGGNGNMAWSGQCAYIAGDGVAVVDVKDPTKPRLARTLRGKGSDISIETIGAIDVGDRHLLAAGKYGLGGSTYFPTTGPIDLYDTTDCSNPKLVSSFTVPANTHNLTFSPDGNRIYSTLPLQAIDVTNPRAPKLLGNLEDDMRAQGFNHLYYAHEAWPSADGKRLFLGGQVPGDQETWVLDIDGWPKKPVTVLGRSDRAGHSIRNATINGRKYLLHSDESVVNPLAKGCLPEDLSPIAGASQPYLTDITNERALKTVSKFRLAINEKQNCAQQVADNTNQSSHYHDVDDPNKTTFALLSMWNAGLRIVDVRNPARMSEVAYFNPGRFQPKQRVRSIQGPDLYTTGLKFQGASGVDQAWAHVRYQPESGLIWLTTQAGGFWVLELEPQVRAALNLPSTHAYKPNGSIPRPKATQLRIGNLRAQTASYYCTLNTLPTVAS